MLGELDPEALAGMFTVHVAAASALANAVVPRMPDGGRVLLIGSRTSTGSPGKSQYAATKAALLGMGRTWAQELAPRGITVNVLSPGPTDTPMLADPGPGGHPAEAAGPGRSWWTRRTSPRWPVSCWDRTGSPSPARTT